MTVRRNFRSILSILFCTGFIGCSSATFIQEVPAHLKIGKLYLDPKTIELNDRQYKTEEGFIAVNENPSDLNSRRITLPVLQVRSTSDHPSEPIFSLNGGPGQSNIWIYGPLVDLLENHDLVLVGYRGADGSTVLKSAEIEKALKGDGGDLLGDKSLSSLSEAVGSFSRNLKARGIDISHYTMVDVISDLEIAREAFGYETISLFSVSYGTRVALIYSYLHPSVVFRSVMMSVNPPGRFVWDPKKIDDQFQYYDRLFAADSNHYDGRPLSQSIRTTLAKMPSRWSLFFKLDPGKIRVITFLMLCEKRSAAFVFHCYRAAEEGDYSGLYLLQMAYDFGPPSMVWGDLFAKASTDVDSTINYVSAMRDSTTVMGSPVSLFFFGMAQEHWPIHRIPPELNQVRPSDVQTLLISGSIDFSTPSEYATNELLPFLRNGRQVILREMGHVGDILTLQPGALTHLLGRFYDEGVVDDSKFTYDPMDFNPPPLPLWAKVLYSFVLLLSLF